MLIGRPEGLQTRVVSKQPGCRDSRVRGVLRNLSNARNQMPPLYHLQIFNQDFRKDVQISEFPSGLSTDYAEVFLTSAYCGITRQAGTTEANLRARTRLSAPIRRVSSPRVEAKTGANGNPLQIVLAASALRSSPAINGQARAITPARITASGLNPFVRFAIPNPR